MRYATLVCVIVMATAFPIEVSADVIGFDSTVTVEGGFYSTAVTLTNDITSLNTTGSLSLPNSTQAVSTTSYVYQQGQTTVNGLSYQTTTFTWSATQSYGGDAGTAATAYFGLSFNASTDYEYQFTISDSISNNAGPSLFLNSGLSATTNIFNDVNIAVNHQGYIVAGSNVSADFNYGLQNSSLAQGYSYQLPPASASELVTLALINLGTTYGPYPEPIAVPFPNPHAVPEPSSLALLGLGGIGMAVGAYRKRRMAAGV